VTGRGRTCDAPRFKRALYRLSYGQVDGPSQIRTGGLLLIREALCQLSYPPACRAARVSVQTPEGDSTHTQAARDALRSLSATYRIVRSSSTILSTPLAYPSTLDPRPGRARRPTWGGVGARCSTVSLNNRHAKVTRTTHAVRRQTVEDLSLSGGASIGVGTFQAEHHLLVGNCLTCLQKQRRRPIGSPLPAVLGVLR
jgi:hypothetical protein